MRRQHGTANVVGARLQSATPARPAAVTCDDETAEATRLRQCLCPRPNQLELDLLLRTQALVLDVEGDICRDAESLAGDLNRERLSGFDRVCEPAQLRNELCARVGACEVSVCHSGSALVHGGWGILPGAHPSMEATHIARDLGIEQSVLRRWVDQERGGVLDMRPAGPFEVRRPAKAERPHPRVWHDLRALGEACGQNRAAMPKSPQRNAASLRAAPSSV
jgi:transposase-like protein